MSFEVAKKAIDMYGSLIKEGERYNPNRELAIGFYGGEPLLNFDLIKRCVKYIESNYCKWNYSITTNGSLLDGAKVEWLIDHEFNIAVSIDGPEKEHNRNRIFIDGTGTFARVMENVAPVIDKGYEKLSSSSVYDLKGDIFVLDDFFRKSGVPRLGNATIVSNTAGCTYYKQHTERDFLEYQHQLGSARERYIERIGSELAFNDKSSYLNALFDGLVHKMLFGPAMIQLPVSVTGACVPGHKLFVDVEGTIHACERILPNLPIGTIEDGLNYSKIAEILRTYVDHMDKCASCSLSKLCSNCLHTLRTDAGFMTSSDACQNVETNMLKNLSTVISIAEKCQEWVNELGQMQE
jgi:uncharacterized protein